jgi:HEAT repeat protein
MSTCEELEAVLADFRLGDDSSLGRLDTLEGVEACIAEGLVRSASSEDWSSFERYLLAASRHPDRSMTSVLCEVLTRQLDDVNNEDIVDVLGIIADPAAVECLGEAMWRQPPWDEYRNLAVKAVWALAKIGTPEALDVLRDAASTGPAEVREAAAHKLGPTGS